jgi:hypothetical protein
MLQPVEIKLSVKFCLTFLGVCRVLYLLVGDPSPRGLQSANKFMMGAAIAYNLKKWLNYQEQKRKTAVVAIKKTGEVFAFCF